MNEPDARRESIEPSRGFPPIARNDARVLILGSLPGQASLRAKEYYAHPRNAFWEIMQVIAGAAGSYASRCHRLQERRIAVWDVLSQSVRPGSLDADIDMTSVVPNDFERFFAAHRDIRLVCFNGRKARQVFGRYVRPSQESGEPAFVRLPSTSPAHAAMRFAEKLEIWRSVIEPELGREDEA